MHSRLEGSRPRARVGFTLIELLTVIAIIGILAAIIIPTVGKVRSTAKKAQCVARIREWGAATSLCANDFKSNIPLFFSSGSFTYSDYITKGRSMIVTADDGRDSARSIMDAMSVCPTGINGGNSLGSVKQYAFVVPIGLDKKKTAVFGGSADDYFYKASEAAAPSKLLLMIEVANLRIVDPRSLSGIPTAITADNSVEKMQKSSGFVRHGGLANALFLDGHVASLSISDTNYSSSKDLLDRYFSLK